MLPLAKPLTDPLFAGALVTAALLLFARSRSRKDRVLRRALDAALLVVLLGSAVGTDAAVRLLHRTLFLPPRSGAPAIIAVPSSGARGNVLTEYSAERVQAAVMWWREHPRATILMTGADDVPDPDERTRTLRMMREMALRYGVPPGRVALEVRSRNTREHAIEIARLRGLGRSTPIGLVTSASHIRRARREFARYFDTVIEHPVVERPRPVTAATFIPSSAALAEATVALHEWLGIAWYALRA